MGEAKGDEKAEKKGGGGEGEKKKEGGGGKGEKKKENAGGEKKAADGPAPVVFKVDMHCEGCAQKIKRAGRSFNGVEKVSADMTGNKLTVAGAKVDPWKLRDYLEAKIKKKVELISPKGEPPVKKDKDDGGAAKKPAADAAPKNQKKTDEKSKEVEPSTVVLKLRLHCEGCIHRIKKSISKMKGVQEVSVDAAKDLVTVKGTMDPKSLPVALKKKLKRNVEIVQPKKDGGDGEKKEKGGEGGGQKKEKGGEGGDKKDKEKSAAGGGGAEKDKEKGGDGSGEKKDKEKGGEKQGAPATAESGELNKMEYYGGYNYANNGGYAQPYPYPYGQQVQMLHAPQIFSDENPNACSVM